MLEFRPLEMQNLPKLAPAKANDKVVLNFLKKI